MRGEHTSPDQGKPAYIRVAATLHPATSKRPPRAAWAFAVEDLDKDTEPTARMRAAGAIATTATHGPGKTRVLDLVTDVPVLVTDCRNGCLDVSIGRCESA